MQTRQLNVCEDKGDLSGVCMVKVEEKIIQEKESLTVQFVIKQKNQELSAEKFFWHTANMATLSTRINNM